MKTILALLLLLAPLASAEPRDPFPDDYVPHSCAPELCGELTRLQIMRFGTTFRGFNIDPRWLRANWNDLEAALKPICNQMATCFATGENTEVFCTDLVRQRVLDTANRFTRPSHDWDQWTMAALTYYLAHFDTFPARFKEARSCAAAQAKGELRRFEAWTEPATFGDGYDGTLTVFALDSETRVPVLARVVIKGQKLDPIDAPDGLPITAAPLKWPVTFNRVPNGSGHEDLEVPLVQITAEGYEPVALKLNLEVPKAIVEMQPGVSQLKPGKNRITVTARDAGTGKPVELRVMAGDQVLGDTNKPLVLELPANGKRPEIWVTSLFDRYSDLVVAPAGR